MSPNAEILQERLLEHGTWSCNTLVWCFLPANARATAMRALFGLLSLALSAAVSLAGPAATPSPVDRTPIVFYLAKGEPDACGSGCSEWIAAEGYIDPRAAQRLRTFLKPPNRAKLPIFFQSPGGIQQQAIEIGLLMRERGMTAGVSQTVPEGCDKADHKTCQTLKRSGRALVAELRSIASCNSACVYALLGAKTRQVPPGAALGVHSSRLVGIKNGQVIASPEVSSAIRKRHMSTQRTQLQKYIGDMGIASRLLETADKIPHEQVRRLSRDEIAAFGIDTRGFQESRWTIIETRDKRPVVLKFITQVKGAERKEFRTSVIQLTCTEPRRVIVIFSRGLASHEIGNAATTSFAVGSRVLVLRHTGAGKQVDAFDAGGLFDNSRTSAPFEYFDEAVVAGGIAMTEGDLKSQSLQSERLQANHPRPIRGDEVLAPAVR